MKEELKKMIESFDDFDDEIYDDEPEYDDYAPEFDNDFDDHEAEDGYDMSSDDIESYEDENSGFSIEDAPSADESSVEEHDTLDDFINSLKNDNVSDEEALDEYNSEFGEALKALNDKEAKLAESLKKVQEAKAKLLNK